MTERHTSLPIMICAVLLLLLGSGCRKDRDDTAPAVSILLPTAGHTLAIPDTLLVRVEVKDDRLVQTIWIALTDMDGVPVAPAALVQVNASSGTYEKGIAVTDEGLTTGNYTVTVRADDGVNTGSAFRQVNVLAAPLRLRSLFITPPFGTAPAPIFRIDSVGVLTEFTSMADLNGAAVDGATQHLVLAGGHYAPLLSLATLQGAGNWQVANQNGLDQPYFRHLRLDAEDGRVYFGTNEGFVRGFTGNGAQTFTALTQVGYLSVSTAVVGDRLVCAQKAISLPDRRLVSFAYTSGMELVWYSLDLDVVHMDQRTASSVLVFGDREGEGVVQERNVTQGGVFEMRVFPEGPIRAVQRLDNGTWAIALPGKIVRFNYMNNSVITLAQGFDATDLAFEMATGRLYAAVGDQVLLLDPVSGNTLGTLPLPQVVGRILPLLNR